MGSGASEFPDWGQPWGPWTTGGYCFVGCTPLSAAVALEYWNENGYPAAMDSGSPDVPGTGRWSNLNSLRAGMGTTCDGATGMTSSGRNIANGIDAYLIGQGLHWTVSGDTSNMWSRIRTQIDRGRPILLHWRGTPGHSVAVYEYTVGGSRSTDFVCFKPGDGRSYECDSRSDHTWDRVTRMVP